MSTQMKKLPGAIEQLLKQKRSQLKALNQMVELYEANVKKYNKSKKEVEKDIAELVSFIS